MLGEVACSPMLLFFSSRRRHTRCLSDWSSDVCSSDLEFKMDKTCNIGVGIGKRSFTAAQILENAKAVLDAVGKAKPASFKGNYIKNVAISSSQSPSVRIASTEYGKY